MVFPVINAGPTFRPANASGKFQAVSPTVTP